MKLSFMLIFLVPIFTPELAMAAFEESRLVCLKSEARLVAVVQFLLVSLLAVGKIMP